MWFTCVHRRAVTAQGTESTSPESKISPAAYLRPQGCISCPNRSHETTSPGHQWSTSCTIFFCSQKLESRSKKLKFNSSRALRRKCLVCAVIFPFFCVWHYSSALVALSCPSLSSPLVTALSVRRLPVGQSLTQTACTAEAPYHYRTLHYN